MMPILEKPLADPALKPLTHFDGARDHASPADRLKAVRRSAARLREELLSGPSVPYYRSFDLIRVPYPTRYALRDACLIPVPYIHIINRVFIVQFKSPSGLKTMLVSPSDVKANRSAPYFQHLARGLGPVGRSLEPVIAPQLGTVEGALAEAGLKPEDVDYITYDHLHTQDLRRWLGSKGRPAFFPNAKLLIMRQEWVSTLGLLPPQAYWYCPDGLAGVPSEKVVLLDSDVHLGEGVALVRTPGHTEGNHSIVVRTPEGLLVTSENGVGADCYAPQNSRIPGMRRYARDTGLDVVLNGNTMEGGLDQYVSMVLERELAGPSARNPDFPNTVCSSELTSYWLFPGVSPTFTFGELSFGAPARR